MDKLIFSVIAFCLLVSCQRNDEDACKISTCLDEKIESFKAATEAVSLKTTSVAGETHYWFNTNATHWDGVEYILNESCDTVCYFCGECFGPECMVDYLNADWKTIWEK